MTEFYHIKDGILEAYTGREEEIIVPGGIHTIGEGAFKGCVSLKKVVLPVGLQYIMGDAFKGCRKLEEVEIPESVTYIGSYAFHRCHALKQVILPPSVEELGDCAFLYCDGLTEVRIPGVKRLGSQAFANGMLLEKLEISRELDENCICDVFTGCGRVTEISFADGECWRMPNVIEVMVGQMQVPSLVRRIVADILRMMELDGRCMLRFLVNIKHVEVPEGIESLGKSCFFDMRGILSVKLPKSLKSIESRAFRNCIGLEKVSFQGTDVQIHEDAFKNCTSLKTVRTCDGEEFIFSGLSDIMRTGEREGETAELLEIVRVIHKQILGNFRLSGTMLLKYLGAESRVVVPEGVTMIAEEAFAGNETIDKVLLPESLQRIGAEAFRDCLLLQTIALPEGLKQVGAGAFENCVKLLRISLPTGITALEARTFRHCRALREVNFPEQLLEIGESAFYGCLSLKKVQFPERLLTIGEMAFYQCSGLRELQLPSGARYVGSLAFAKSGLQKVRISGSKLVTGAEYGTDVFGDCRKLKSLVLEEGVRHIPDKLAFGCTALERVSLPQSLETVGRHPLEGSVFLEKWRMEQTGQNAYSIGDVIFWDGRDLEGVVRIPEYVQIVSGGAFYGNTKVTEIYLPESVRYIGAAAFKGCRNLHRVWLPSGVKHLEAEVFSGCIELKEVTLAGCSKSKDVALTGCGELDEAVLAECSELEEVVLAECNVLEEKALTGHSKLDEVVFAGGREPEEVVLSERDMCQSQGRFSDQNMLPVWSSIGERAFYNCRKLCRLELEQVKRFGKEALAGCTALECGRIGKDLTIGERAFEGTAFLNDKKNGLCVVGNVVVSGEICEGKVCLPEGVTGIAPYAFATNRRITELIFPESLQWVGEGAFFGCSGLSSVTFSEGLQRIGSHAFEKCISLQKVECLARQAGESAFAGCVSLVRASLPRLTILGKRLFAGCTSLGECICNNAKVVQPFCFSGCTELKNFSFYSLIVVREYAFDRCESLKSAKFRDGICLRAHAFEDCSGLEEINLSGEGAERNIQEYALSGCTALHRVVYQGRAWEFGCYGDILSSHIPETVRFLFHNAFSCFEVEQEEILLAYRGAAQVVKIPEGIRRIGAEVFRDRTMLREVEIPESVEYIGARAFHGTAWMEQKRKEQALVVIKDMLLDGSGCKGDVVVPPDIRLVCGWAFANGLGIERIRFLSERVRVEEYAFRNCIFLREMVLPDGSVVRFEGIEDRKRDLPPLAKQAVMDSLNCFKTDEKGALIECTGNISRLRLVFGITAVGEGVFQDGNLLTEVIFPETVRSIGRRAFAGCKWLNEVRQAYGVEWIGELAFSGCSSLKVVELSERFRSMGARAFENCVSLEEIRIPEGVEEIPERAFFRCHSLKSVSLPSTLKRIGKEAFAFCRELSEVYVPVGVQVGERAFYRDI